jgi:hypothetical protein
MVVVRRPSGAIDAAPGAPVPSPAIKAFADAIARAEGFYVANSVPARAHNPGNLKLPGTPTIAGGISVFASDAEGWSKLYRQLNLIVTRQSRVYRPEMTILEMAQRWTATVSEQTAWARNVARGIGAAAGAIMGWFK